MRGVVEETDETEDREVRLGVGVGVEKGFFDADEVVVVLVLGDRWYVCEAGLRR